MNVLTSCEMHYFLLASFFVDENFNILLLLAILVVCVLDVSICCLFLFVCWCAWLAERKRRCQMEKLKKGFGKNSLFGGSDCLYSIFIELFHCVFDPVANFCSVFFFFFIKFIQFERSGFALLTKNEKYQQFCVCCYS